MLRGTLQVELWGWLQMFAIRASKKLSAEHPKTPAMPPADLGDGRHYIRLGQIVAERMVSN